MSIAFEAHSKACVEEVFITWYNLEDVVVSQKIPLSGAPSYPLHFSCAHNSFRKASREPVIQTMDPACLFDLFANASPHNFAVV